MDPVKNIESKFEILTSLSVYQPFSLYLVHFAHAKWPLSVYMLAGNFICLGELSANPQRWL